MPIRWRLALFGVGLTAAALTVFAILLNAIVVPGAAEDQDVLLGELADAAVVSLEATDLETTSVSPIASDVATADQPFIVVTAEDGTVLYTTALIAGAMPRLPAALIVETIELGSSEATVDGVRYQARHWDGGGSAAVAAGQSTRVVEEQLTGFRGFLVVFAFITLLAAAVVAWVVSGRALRPLKTLAVTTDEIGRTGDLSRRLPPQKRNDEVGALTASFNAMLDRLEDTRRRLEASLMSQRRFVADASHELRTPLTSIRTNAGFLEQRDGGAVDRQEAIEDIAAEADRMTRLVDDLLLLARGDAEVAVEFAPVALEPLVVDLRRNSRHLDNRLTVTANGAPVVEGDEDSLTRLIRILVDNADRHGDGSIDLTVTRRDGAAEIAVADDGPGIPEEEIARIFDRFYRVDPARSGSGFGLGLSIADAIVQAHGGTIAVASRDRGGAVFTVTLPLAGSSPPLSGSEAEER